MKKIEYRGIKFYSDFWILPKGFCAITLFGRVFSNYDIKKLNNYLETYSGRVMVNHERIHMMQANTFKTKYLGFYLFYLWYWFIGLFKYGVKRYASYRQIPFEKEAYDKENDFNCSEKDIKWREYIKH